MKKNRFVVDLGNQNLSDERRNEILDAISKITDRKVKSKKSIPFKATAGFTEGAEIETKKATITVVFRNTEPRFSEVEAIHNGEAKNPDKNGEITYENVKRGEIIEIEGKSLGSSEISIEREARPQKKKFSPGTFSFDFFILK